VFKWEKPKYALAKCYTRPFSPVNLLAKPTDATGCLKCRDCIYLAEYRDRLGKGERVVFCVGRLPHAAIVLLSSTLKMEATRSPETLTDFHRTTMCYIPEDTAFN
jgi:hypothetical protein